MKKNILMLMMLIAMSSYSNSNPNMSKNPHYRVPLTNEFVEAIEQKGYNDFLRIVDEQNIIKQIKRKIDYTIMLI